MKWGLKTSMDFFTMGEVLQDSFRGKRGVLLLPTSFFNVVSITLVKREDERARALDIEEILEESIEGYESVFYVEREITLFEEEDTEKVLVILLEKDKVRGIFEELQEKNIVLLGIYPLFFMEFFSGDEKARNYVEISEDKTQIFSYLGNKLVDYTQLDMGKDEVLTGEIENYEELKLSQNFVYPNNAWVKEYLDIETRDWKEYEPHFKKEYNFLATEHIDRAKHRKNIVIFICILAILGILEVATFFLYHFYIAQNRENLEKLQYSYQETREKLEDTKERVKNLEEELKEIREEGKKRGIGVYKVSKMIREIIKKGKDIEITSIEYDGFKMVVVSGKSADKESIYDFQKSILESKTFKKINHDFIKKEGEGYIFSMDIEVAYGDK